MRRVFAVAAVAALITIPAAGAAPRLDYAGVALNVLPPGQSGDLLFPPTAKDQLRAGNVKAADLRRYFKSLGELRHRRPLRRDPLRRRRSPLSVRGEWRAMTTLDAGVLKGTATQPGREIVFRETVHGPVLGYATYGGRNRARSRRVGARTRRASA